MVLPLVLCTSVLWSVLRCYHTIARHTVRRVPSTSLFPTTRVCDRSKNGRLETHSNSPVTVVSNPDLRLRRTSFVRISATIPVVEVPLLFPSERSPYERRLFLGTRPQLQPGKRRRSDYRTHLIRTNKTGKRRSQRDSTPLAEDGTNEFPCKYYDFTLTSPLLLNDRL